MGVDRSANREDATASEAPGVHVCDVVVRNGYLLTMDEERRVYPRGLVAIEDGVLVAVGDDDELRGQFDARETIDAGGAIIHPGFIDAHMHVAHHLLRGAEADDMPYPDQAVFHTEYWDSARDEDEYAGSLLACLEMARNGTTYFLEAGTVLEPDAAAAAAEAIGMRGSVADPFLWDRGGFSSDVPPLKRAPPDLARALGLLGGQLERNRNENALIRGHVAIVGMGACSDELELAAKACADENGAILTRHQSYNDDDVAADDTRLGRHPLVHYADLGTLGANCTLAHMNFVRDDEVAPVRETGISIVWCPSASMLFGIGATFTGRHVELYKQGVNVALGSDAVNSALNFDLAVQGYLAVLTAREKTRTRDALIAEDILEMLTINGASAVGEASRLGSLEVGKRADLVIRREDLPEAQPPTDPVQSLVYGTFSKSVDTVIVNGTVIVRAGRSTRVDEAEVYARARSSASRILGGMTRFSHPRWRNSRRTSA